MEFVFSAWYFVIIALVAGIAACLVVFFMMDKKDKVLIEQFVKEAQSEENAATSTETPAEVENKTK